MYPTALIAEIHRELEKIYNRGLVLLGGSYLYGEAEENSDLDFYVICPWRAFFYYCRHKELAAGIKTTYPQISLMIVPKWFFKKGWYYIYGRDLREKICASPINKKIIWRNCLKLACFSYLKFLLSAEHTPRQRYLLKAARLLAAALSLENLKGKSEPLFTADSLKGAMAKLAINGEDLLPALKSAWQGGRANLSFSLANYLIYNFRFLPKGHLDFLGRDPDKFILDKFFSGFETGKDLNELAIAMQKIVFPVFVI